MRTAQFTALLATLALGDFLAGCASHTRYPEEWPAPQLTKLTATPSPHNLINVACPLIAGTYANESDIVSPEYVEPRRLTDFLPVEVEKASQIRAVRFEQTPDTLSITTIAADGTGVTKTLTRSNITINPFAARTIPGEHYACEALNSKERTWYFAPAGIPKDRDFELRLACSATPGNTHGACRFTFIRTAVDGSLAVTLIDQDNARLQFLPLPSRGEHYRFPAVAGAR